jgi:hypothetical protein
MHIFALLLLKNPIDNEQILDNLTVLYTINRQRFRPVGQRSDIFCGEASGL